MIFVNFKTSLVIFSLLAFSFFSVLTSVLAQESTPSARQEFQISSDYVRPGSFKYGIARLKENARLLILSPFLSSKADFYEKLADKRLGELDKVVSEKDLNNIEKSSTRYFTTVGILTEYINKKNLNDRKSRLADKFARHKMVIEELMPSFNDTTAEWRFLKHDADYLVIYISQLQGGTTKQE